MARRRRKAGTATRLFRFIGQNIKGNPEMTGPHVGHDLKADRKRADVLVSQEFEWSLYWRVLAAVLPKWRTFPAKAQGLRRPVFSGQPVMWRRRLFRRGRTWQRLAHKGKAGLSDTRFLRAVELFDRATKLGFIVGGTHNVVGGDAAHDGALRKAMLAGDLDHLEKLLEELVATGLPIIWEEDGNIHKATAAYRRLREIVESHGGTFHGELGVEYLFTIPGKTTVIEVEKDFTVPVKILFTDHEGRGIDFRVVPRKVA